MKLVITEHAVDRYIERISPVTREAARARLENYDAVRLKRTLQTDGDYYALPDCVAVVSFRDGLYFAVTVMKNGEEISRCHNPEMVKPKKALAAEAVAMTRRLRQERGRRGTKRAGWLRER